MPLVPLALERMGHDKLTIGIVAAAWGVGMLATASHIPRLAARFGAVPFIVGAVVAGSAITVAYTLTDSVVVWFILTLLHGVTGGVPWVVSEIWMNVVVEEKRRGRVMAALFHAGGARLGAGPVRAAGRRRLWPRPFITCAALALAGRGAAAALLEDRAADRASPRTAATCRSSVLAPLAMLAAFCCGLGEQIAFSFLPVYAVGAGVAAETGALWLSTFVLGNVVLQWPIGWMADHFDRRAVLAGCALASALLVILLSLVSAQSLAVIAVIALWGGCRLRSTRRPGAARPAHRRRRHRPRQHRLQHALHPGRPGRPADRRRGDGRCRDPGLGWTLAVFYAAAGDCRLGGVAPARLISLNRG
jgi:MFS family permease